MDNDLCCVSDLKQHGFTIIRIDAFLDTQTMQQQLADNLVHAPEYLVDPSKFPTPHSYEDARQTLHMFTRIPTTTASCYHLPCLRIWRYVLYKQCMTPLWDLYNTIYNEDDDNKCIEMLIGTLEICSRDTSPMKQPRWERTVCNDDATNVLSSDDVYQGFINLNSFTHRMSCVCGSHNTGDLQTARVTEPSMCAVLNRKHTVIEVPPGHVLIYNVKLLRETALRRGADGREPMLRMNFGWRRTQQIGVSYIPDMDRRLHEFDVIPTYNGKLPRLYSTTAPQEYIDTISTCFRRLPKLHKNDWTIPTLCPSLKEMHLSTGYKSYTDEELAMHVSRPVLNIV